MKLALTGAHSTGKTTLLRGYVEKRLGLKVGVIEEIARNVIKRGFPMGKMSTAESYMNFVKDQLRAERLANQGCYDIVISDRSIIDAVAYSLVNKEMFRSEVADYVIEMLYEVWRIEESFYDCYVYCPAEFAMVSDGVRDQGEDYREAIAAKIEMLLNDSPVRHITVVGTPEERLRQFEQCVSD